MLEHKAGRRACLACRRGHIASGCPIHHGSLRGFAALVVCITPYNTDMATTVRPAAAADVPQILTFIRALASYERAPDAVVATEGGFLRDGFGPNPFYSCLIAEHDGKPAGFALYFYNYSTWMGRPGIYLEDLFVLPEFRGLGIGKALLNGWRRLRWKRAAGGCNGRFWTGIRRPSTSMAPWGRVYGRGGGMCG